jgi:hypothetical protein
MGTWPVVLANRKVTSPSAFYTPREPSPEIAENTEIVVNQSVTISLKELPPSAVRCDFNDTLFRMVKKHLNRIALEA